MNIDPLIKQHILEVVERQIDQNQGVKVIDAIIHQRVDDLKSDRSSFPRVKPVFLVLG